MAQETELERLVVRMVGDTRDYTSKMREAKEDGDRFGLSFERHQVALAGFRNSLRGYAGQIVSMVSGIAGGFGILNSVIGGVKLFSSFERAEIEFGTMLGTIEDGKKMMADLQKLAAQTPLELAPLQQGTQMLLQFGIKGEYAVGILKMLGDVTGGSADKMLRMARAYGQMVGTGRLQGDELNQMIEAGFNPLQVMAEQKAGKDNKAGVEREIQLLMKRKESGQLSVGEITEAFKTATAEGGRYFNNMMNTSKSLEGTFSTMLDDLNSVRRAMGEQVDQVIGFRVIMLNVSDAAQKALAMFQAIPPEIKKWIVLGGAALVGVGTLMLLWPIIAASVGTVFAVLKAGLAVVLSPIGLLVAATALFLTQTEAGGRVVGWFGEQIQSVIRYFKPLADGLRAAFAAGDMALAWKIFVTGLELEFTKFTAWFTEYWNATKDVFVDGWHGANTDISLGTVDLIKNLKTNYEAYFDWFLMNSARVARAVGDTELADDLEAIMFASKDQIAAAAEASKRQIKDQAKAAQDARTAERQADLDAVRQRQKDLQGELEGSILVAKWREQVKKMWGGDEVKLPPITPPAPIAVKLLPKFDAAAFDSAEAQARIAEYAAKFRLDASKTSVSSSAVGMGSMPKVAPPAAELEVAPLPRNVTLVGVEKTNDILSQVVRELKEMNAHPDFTFATADLGPGDSGGGDW